jgi:hypothetical protein
VNGPVASCWFKAGAEAAAEEAVLMRMLQSLLACLRAPAATALGNQHVCTAVNTCIRVVHQAGAKGELLQAAAILAARHARALPMCLCPQSARRRRYAPGALVWFLFFVIVRRQIINFT